MHTIGSAPLDTNRAGVSCRSCGASTNQHATVESYGIIVLGAATTQGSPFWQTWGANSYEPRHQGWRLSRGGRAR